MTTQPTALPTGPYRFERGETADTYRIFAAGDDKPMVELIYIGGAEDFAAAALGLARQFTASSMLLEACDLVQRAHVGDGVTMAEAVDACLLAIDEANTGTPSQPVPDQHTTLLMAALRSVLPYAEAELASLQETQKRDGGLEAEVAACDAAIESASQLLSQIEAGAA